MDFDFELAKRAAREAQTQSGFGWHSARDFVVSQRKRVRVFATLFKRLLRSVP